ncbi:hypothetical protein ABZX98_07315 [Streptomyces sp. NPDC002992]|uniref:hypothetical protein n=1 Tax=Streptomyces sp. NPDC002992 TaxID=3154273 RepID=UPI0033BAC3C9
MEPEGSPLTFRNNATDAYAIDCAVGSYRGVVAIEASDGAALAVVDAQMAAARDELASQGMRFELSAAAGLAGPQPGRHRGTGGRRRDLQRLQGHRHDFPGHLMRADVRRLGDRTDRTEGRGAGVRRDGLRTR